MRVCGGADELYNLFEATTSGAVPPPAVEEARGASPSASIQIPSAGTNSVVNRCGQVSTARVPSKLQHFEVCFWFYEIFWFFWNKDALSCGQSTHLLEKHRAAIAWPAAARTAVV
jgi:hypothetical protein